MVKVQLRSKLSEAEMKRRAGTAIVESDVAILLHSDAFVYKPNGDILCALKRAAIPKSLTAMAYPALHSLKDKLTDNRGNYGGGKREPARFREDGRVSRQNRVVDEEGKILEVASSVIGYYDRYPRIPFCRQTAFTAHETAKWKACLPMIEHVARVFEQTLPERYAKQKEVADRTTQDFVIQNTPFTTLTVNNNVVSSIHTDKGDFKEGCGVISVIRRGEYTGGWLVFPEFKVAADLQDGDVLFFNSHDWHGNLAMEGKGHERISIVYYYRSDMQNCGSLAEELERAKQFGGTNIRPKKKVK